MARKIYPIFVEETKSWLSDADGFVCVDLTGVGANDTNLLRKEIRTAGGSLKWLKNSAGKKAFEEMDKADASSVLNGPTAVAWGEGDAIISVCKILSEWKSKTKTLEFNGAWMQGRVLPAEEVGQLALIPPREQLHAMVVRGLAAPASGLVSVLSGLMRNLVTIIGKISERSGEDGKE